ncbi:MAG: radical SAM protein [Gammaproteobacteria bacterium]|nr:radical SAM protein [Gammaproteobacteria bacterium]MDH5803433.1 radical SAM protein [Gammaproteobacteria bacterium]
MTIKQLHVTVLSNLHIAYDKYTRSYDKSKLPSITYPGVFFLLHESSIDIGINKAQALLETLAYPGNELIALETSIAESDLIPNEFTGTGLGQYIESSSIVVNAIYTIRNKKLLPLRMEEAMAKAYRVMQPSSSSYSDLVPRSVSVLPVARGCQAKCSFCFSSSSISTLQRKNSIDFERVHQVFSQAKQAGAIRGVITGGGEPGLLPRTQLHKLIQISQTYFDKTVLISNGYFVSSAANVEQALLDLDNQGLTVLAISRHHFDDQKCQSIMNLNVDFERVHSAYKTITPHLAGLRLRLVCVMQKDGVDSAETIERYISWAAQMGIEQICFKELYVSTSTESLFYENEANTWSYDNQVPLSLLVCHAREQNWSMAATLPWGSPVYEVERYGRRMSIAAYTEPSLSWELEHKLCRSWNLMADGRCFASLESEDSEVIVRESVYELPNVS